MVERESKIERMQSRQRVVRRKKWIENEHPGEKGAWSVEWNMNGCCHEAL